MAKVTSKLQVTIPKAIADRYRIAPGDDIAFVPGADAIRIVPSAPRTPRLDAAARLRLFDQGTARQQKREHEQPVPPASPSVGRGWTRDDLYDPPRGWRP